MKHRLAIAALVMGAAMPPAFAQIRFEEISQKAGLKFELRNGAGSGPLHQVELMPAGVAAFDFNNDGCMDIFFVNGAALPSLVKTDPEFHNRLFRNNCDLTFTDVTAKAGLEGKGYAMAVAAADYDNDGFTDLFVAGVNGSALYRNLGDGRFEDVTAKAGVSSRVWSISAGWFDYDNDGFPDLFVSNYVAWDPATEPRCGPPDAPIYCHPEAYRGLPNQLFHNNRDGTFTDVSRASGIAAHTGKGMGVAFADFDGDGFTDIFVANDSYRSFLFRNQGDGTFREVGLEAGVALREDGAAIAGMGADFRDYDNDGLPDLVVSGMINDSFLLFRNLGRRFLFEDRGRQTGLLMGTRQLTGWGLGMYDFDNDGWKDLFFAASHFPRLDRYLGRNSELANRVFRNVEGKRFEEAPPLPGAALHHGAAFADFDNDGRVDVVVSVLNGPARLYRNITKGGHWAAFKLQGLGATVRLTLSDGRTLTNHATTSVGYASSSEPLVRFGLGDAQIERAEIRWPSGKVLRLPHPGRDRIIEPGR